MRFVVGRNNLAATIFVPYDCGYKCPFCTTKHEYKDMTNFSLERIINSIKTINGMPDVKDVVFTGGEPFADLKQLQQMLNAVSHEKNIYINTTLPARGLRETLDFIARNSSVISGLNISRHIDSFVSNKTDIALGELNYMPIRINCVLSREYSTTELSDFIELYKHKNRVINFRADYRHITTENLKTLNNEFIKQLLSLGLEYQASNGCLVCNTDYFTAQGKYYIVYHRGIERSSIKLGETIIVNDIIIKQTGSMYYDWDDNNSDEVIDIEGMIKTFWVGTKPTEKDMPVKIAEAKAVVAKAKKSNPEPKLVSVGECYPRINPGDCYRPKCGSGGC